MSTINPNIPPVGKAPASPPKPAAKSPDDLTTKQELAFKDVYDQFYAQLKGPTVRTQFLNNNKDDDSSGNRSLGVA